MDTEITFALQRFARDRRLTIEPLEDRRLLSLALQGVSLGYPQITYDALGPLSYHADSQLLSFQLDAPPQKLYMTETSPSIPISAPRNFAISIHVDNRGNLIGGVSGPDLTVTGSVTVGGVNYSGILLTGEVTQFGFYDSGTSTDSFDFRFIPTGGALASSFAGQDIGVSTTSENSTYTGSFATDFTGSCKGGLVAIAPLRSSLAGYAYNDANNDGIKQPSEVGISGVPVSLTGTDVTGAAVSLSTSPIWPALTPSPNCSPERTRSVKPSRPAILTARTHKGLPARARRGTTSSRTSSWPPASTARTTTSAKCRWPPASA